MKVSERKDGDVTILEFSGRLTIGEGDVKLREAVHKALDAGRRKILLVMEDVRYVDSSGIGEMVAAYASTRNRGGSLKLARLSPKVADILGATELSGVLEAFDSVDTAVADLKGLP